MSRAILEFLLPDEEEAHTSALNGKKWVNVVFEFDQWLKSQIKYGEGVKLDKVRDQLYATMADNGVSFE